MQILENRVCDSSNTTTVYGFEEALLLESQKAVCLSGLWVSVLQRVLSEYVHSYGHTERREAPPANDHAAWDSTLLDVKSKVQVPR